MELQTPAFARVWQGEKEANGWVWHRTAAAQALNLMIPRACSTHELEPLTLLSSRFSFHYQTRYYSQHKSNDKEGDHRPLEHSVVVFTLRGCPLVYINVMMVIFQVSRFSVICNDGMNEQVLEVGEGR